jgi:SOS-response transcriptional repressor LexA
MDENGKFPNGLAEAMVAEEIGPTDLARAISTSKQNIQRWANQSRKLPLEFGERIAKHLRRLPAEILLPSEARVGLDRVRLISWVSAGKLTRGEHQDEDIDSVLIGGLPKGDWVALRVEGDSMDRISPPESVIFINRRDRRLVPNGCYVVMDEDGNATYKRFRPNPNRFEPVSTNKDLEPIFFDKEPQILGRVRMTIMKM